MHIIKSSDRIIIENIETPAPPAAAPEAKDNGAEEKAGDDEPEEAGTRILSKKEKEKLKKEREKVREQLSSLS